MTRDQDAFRRLGEQSTLWQQRLQACSTIADVVAVLGEPTLTVRWDQVYEEAKPFLEPFHIGLTFTIDVDARVLLVNVQFDENEEIIGTAFGWKREKPSEKPIKVIRVRPKED